MVLVLPQTSTSAGWTPSPIALIVADVGRDPRPANVARGRRGRPSDVWLDAKRGWRDKPIKGHARPSKPRQVRHAAQKVCLGEYSASQ